MFYKTIYDYIRPAGDNPEAKPDGGWLYNEHGHCWYDPTGNMKNVQEALAKCLEVAEKDFRRDAAERMKAAGYTQVEVEHFIATGLHLPRTDKE